MEVLFLLGAVVVAAGESATTAPATEGATTAALLGNSLVSSLLFASGFSDTCVAAALDICAPASMQHRPQPLLQVMVHGPLTGDAHLNALVENSLSTWLQDIL